MRGGDKRKEPESEGGRREYSNASIITKQDELQYIHDYGHTQVMHEHSMGACNTIHFQVMNISLPTHSIVISPLVEGRQ